MSVHRITQESAVPPLSDRQGAILARLDAQGFVTLDVLAEAFGVSMQTVRRDVIALADAGLVGRFHGGAGLRAGHVPARLAHADKRALAVEEKQRIAAAAAALTPPGSHVFIDVGTTAEAVASALDAVPGLVVVTNSLHVAGALAPDRHTIRMLPGFVGGADGSITGPETAAALSRLRLDYAFVSCSGVEPEGRVMDFDPGKIAVKRAAMSAAATNVLIAAPEKFGRTAREEFARLENFGHVLTGV